MAKGLFHKGVVESGSTLRLGDLESSEKLAAAVVAELGLNKSTIDKIQTVSLCAACWRRRRRL